MAPHKNSLAAPACRLAKTQWLTKIGLWLWLTESHISYTLKVRSSNTLYTGKIFLSTCLATLLHICKLKPSVAHIIMFVTNLSHSKIQCCKSAEFYMCNCVENLLSYNLTFWQSFTLTSGNLFLLNFLCRQSSLSMKLSVVSDSYA